MSKPNHLKTLKQAQPSTKSENSIVFEDEKGTLAAAN